MRQTSRTVNMMLAALILIIAGGIMLIVNKPTNGKAAHSSQHTSSGTGHTPRVRLTARTIVADRALLCVKVLPTSVDSTPSNCKLCDDQRSVVGYQGSAVPSSGDGVTGQRQTDTTTIRCAYLPSSNTASVVAYMARQTRAVIMQMILNSVLGTPAAQRQCRVWQ